MTGDRETSNAVIVAALHAATPRNLNEAVSAITDALQELGWSEGATLYIGIDDVYEDVLAPFRAKGVTT